MSATSRAPSLVGDLYASDPLVRDLTHRTLGPRLHPPGIGPWAKQGCLRFDFSRRPDAAKIDPVYASDEYIQLDLWHSRDHAATQHGLNVRRGDPHGGRMPKNDNIPYGPRLDRDAWIDELPLTHEHCA